MKLRLGIVALLAVLASCGSSSGSSAASSTRAQTTTTPAPTTTTTRAMCGPSRATTIVTSCQARVYSSHGGVFGCSFASGRPFRLGSAARSIRESDVAPIVLAGADAAYGLSDSGVDTIRTIVAVRRLNDGTLLKQFPATRIGLPEGLQSVASLVARSDGAVAWIVREHSIVGGRTIVEVHAADRAATADRLLDSGAKLVPGSLRLHGSTLTWQDGGMTRHATLR